MKAETYLELRLVLKPLALLEQFAITLQGENLDIDSTEDVLYTLKNTLNEYRESEFEDSFQDAFDLTEQFSEIPIKPLVVR